MREVKTQTEKGKRAGEELRTRTPIPLVKIRDIRVLNPCPSVCIHPPQFCYGGRVRGSSQIFKIKKPSLNGRKTLKVILGNLRGFLPKKFRIFFRALLSEIIGKSVKNTPKNTSNYPQKTCNL
jgi:hypothetical protein